MQLEPLAVEHAVRCRNRHAALFREFDRVANQVEENLAQANIQISIRRVPPASPTREPRPGDKFQFGRRIRGGAKRILVSIWMRSRNSEVRSRRGPDSARNHFGRPAPRSLEFEGNRALNQHEKMIADTRKTVAKELKLKVKMIDGPVTWSNCRTSSPSSRSWRPGRTPA